MDPSVSSIYSSLSDLVLSERIFKDKAELLFKLVELMEVHENMVGPGIFMMIRPRGFGLSLITQSIIKLVKACDEKDEFMLNSNTKIIDDYLLHHNNPLFVEDNYHSYKNTTRNKTDLEIERLKREYKLRDELKKNSTEEQEIEAIKSLYNLPQRPVLVIDFKHLVAYNAKSFRDSLMEILQEQFWINHLESHQSPFMKPKVYFDRLLHLLYEKYHHEIAIIIDNYDEPFISASQFDKNEQDEAVLDYLDLLNVIKYHKASIKWVLLTGHINFALASETSEGLPLVHDLSSNPMFAGLFGITKTDLIELYGKELNKFAENQHLSLDSYITRLEKCYGGFLFADDESDLRNQTLPKMFNPASIAHCISNNGRLLPYATSGRYKFLKKALLSNPKDLDWLFGKDGQDPLFSDSIELQVRGKKLGTLLLQLGFATRTKMTVNQTSTYITWRYRFDYPNLDMKKTLEYILADENNKPDITTPIDFEHEDEEEFYQP